MIRSKINDESERQRTWDACYFCMMLVSKREIEWGLAQNQADLIERSDDALDTLRIQGWSNLYSERDCESYTVSTPCEICGVVDRDYRWTVYALPADC